jgi:uncharacterized protein YdaU (DUF1376 family)
MLSVAEYRTAQYELFGFDFMNSRPWMPLYVNDFHMDTLDLSAEEFGIYMILLMLMWTRDDGALPNDMGWLKRSLQAYVADFHGHSFNRIIPKLLKRYFRLGEDDKWTNKRLTKERQKLAKQSAKQSQNADKRWSKVREINSLADASAMPSYSHSDSDSDSDSHKDKIHCSSDDERARDKNLRVVRGSEDWPRDYFDQFWKAYPRKTGKLAAQRKLEVIRRAGETPFARLLTAVGKINISDPRFIPYPATWLNQGRYLDEDAPNGAEFVPSPDMPTEEELRKRYAGRQGVEGTSNESPRVLERSPGVHQEEHEGRMDVGRARNGRIHSLGEIFPMEGLGAVRASSDPEKGNYWDDDAGEIS